MTGGTVAEFAELGRANGVVLRAAGTGPPVVLFPGMEGSGQSCLHLAAPVVLAPHGPAAGRLLLVDYAAERHRFLGELVDTVAGLLTEHLDGDLPVTWWGQSFGNLLLVHTEQRLTVPTRARVLVSPFTGLPDVLTVPARAALTLTLPVLYRGVTPPVARWVFGPMPRGTGDDFVAALAGMSPADVARRTGWLVGRDHAGAFLAPDLPCGVWLGELDRLVDLPRQSAFFAALTRHGGRLTAVPGAGHVATPPAAVALVRQGVEEWISSASAAPRTRPVATARASSPRDRTPSLR